MRWNENSSPSLIISSPFTLFPASQLSISPNRVVVNAPNNILRIHNFVLLFHFPIVLLTPFNKTLKSLRWLMTFVISCISSSETISVAVPKPKVFESSVPKL